MSEEQKPKNTVFKLSKKIVSSSDMIKAVRELEDIDDFLHQSKLRKPGTNVKPPKSSKTLQDLAELNQISLLDEAKRKRLIEVLNLLEKKAPVIHISFAAEASAVFMHKITEWIRQNTHPYALVNVGLQPSVIVGCEVRTTNKIFDMSLRSKFESTKDILVKKLEQQNG